MKKRWLLLICAVLIAALLACVLVACDPEGKDGGDGSEVTPGGEGVTPGGEGVTPGDGAYITSDTRTARRSIRIRRPFHLAAWTENLSRMRLRSKFPKIL